MESPNIRILKNSVILYVKLIVSGVCGLLISRFALQALGIVDFGLFSLLASVIAFVSIVNTIMVSTSNRFIAVALGKADEWEVNKVFNICLKIHIIISIATLIIATFLGTWYILNKLNYEGSINNALIVFYISVFASCFSFISVPYTGLITAKEDFWTLCYPEMVSYIVKLVITYSLVYFFSNKLVIYAIAQAILTLFPFMVYYCYCKIKYKRLVAYKNVKDKTAYHDILNFSAWVGYGAVAYVAKGQGAAVVVNLFFNTVMNTALGIANTVNSLIGMFSQSISQPIAPQITKSYAARDLKRSEELLVMSTKFSFLGMFFISAPFLLSTEPILKLWLGQVPPYAVLFTRLIIVDALIESLNSGIKNIIFADGNIKMFQIVPSTLKLMSVIVAYFILKQGRDPSYLFYTYISFTILVFFVNQWVLKHSIHFNNRILWCESYLPCLFVVVLFSPCMLYQFGSHSFGFSLLAIVYLALLTLFVGLSRLQRTYFINKIYSLCRIK